MTTAQRFLVFGATGRTGRPFVDLVLREGHRVRALVRDPSALAPIPAGLEVQQGSITELLDLDGLLSGVDCVVMMVGDALVQQQELICFDFVRRVVPAMRRQGVARLLYQAGALSSPPHARLPLPLRIARSTLARSYLGQHRDNEAVMRYLVEEAADLEWVVHRAALRTGRASQRALQRADRGVSVAAFDDCAAYSYRLSSDESAVHTCSTSRYARIWN